MFCNKCGNKIADGARFCGRCGNACAPAPVMPIAPTQPVMDELEMPKASFPMDVPAEPAPVQPEPQPFVVPPMPQYPPQPEPVQTIAEPVPVQPEPKPFAMPPLDSEPKAVEPVSPEPIPAEMPPVEEPVYAPPVQESVYMPPVQGNPTYVPQEEPVYMPPMQPESRPVVTKEDLPPQYRPLGAWSYFGLSLLYTIPVVGLIFLIIFSFKSDNINRRSFTRSYWCSYLIFGGLLALLVGVLAIVDIYLLEDIIGTIDYMF